jgi:creatinine amidohydrolase
VLSHFQPETIDLTQLPPLEEAPAIDPDGDPYGLHRHDPEHVLWGVFGPDPRNFAAEAAPALVSKLTAAINSEITKVLDYEKSVPPGTNLIGSFE